MDLDEDAAGSRCEVLRSYLVRLCGTSSSDKWDAISDCPEKAKWMREKIELLLRNDKGVRDKIVEGHSRWWEREEWAWIEEFDSRWEDWRANGIQTIIQRR
jgi:hypothetical protein